MQRHRDRRHCSEGQRQRQGLVRKEKGKGKIKGSLVEKEMFPRIGITVGITKVPQVVKVDEKILPKENLVVGNHGVSLKQNLTQANAVSV